MHHTQRERTIPCDRLRLSGEKAGEGGNTHISVPTLSTLNFDNDVVCEKNLRVSGTLSGSDGQPMMTRDGATGETTVNGSSVSFDNAAAVNLGNTTVSFDNATVDFDGATVQNLQLDISSLTITAADIQSSNLPNSSLDGEIDALTLATNTNTGRLTGLATNRVMTSNGAGVVVASAIDPQKILDNETNIAQASANNITAINMIVANTALINTNTADVATLQGDVTTLQSTSTGHTSDISTLQTTTTGHTSDISTLQTTTAGHTSDISTLQTQQTTNTAAIASNTTAATNNAADVLALQTLTGTHTADIGALQTTTTQQTADISTNAQGVAQNLANVATNTQGITTNTQAIATNTQAIATNTQAIATNTQDITTNTQGIATNTQAISANGTAISAIQADYVATGGNAVLGDVTTDELTTDGHTITQSTAAGLSNTTTYDIGTRSSSSTAGGITTTTAVNEKVKIHGDNLNPSDASLLVNVHRTTTVTEVDGGGFTTVYPSTTETKRMLEVNDTFLNCNCTFQMPNDKQELLFNREAPVAGQSPVYDADCIFRVGRNSDPNEANILREGAKVYEPNMSAISNPHPTDGTLWNNDLSASKGEYRLVSFNSLFSNFVVPKFKEILVNGGCHQIANFDGVSKSTDTFSTTFKNEITVSEFTHDLSFHTGEASMLATTTDNSFTCECPSFFNKNLTLGSGVDILDSNGNSVLTGGSGGGGSGSLLSSNNVWTGTNEFSAGLSLSSAETLTQRSGGGFEFSDDIFKVGVTGNGLFSRMASAETTAANQLVLIGANTTDTAANTTELLQCVKLSGSQTITGQKSFVHLNTIFDSNINLQPNREIRIQNSAGTDTAYLRYDDLKDLETNGAGPAVSAWTNLTLASGMSVKANSGRSANVSYRTIDHGSQGKQVFLRGMVQTTTGSFSTTNNTTIFTMPTGARPTHLLDILCAAGNVTSGGTAAQAYVFIHSYGTVEVFGLGSTDTSGATADPIEYVSLNNISFWTT